MPHLDRQIISMPIKLDKNHSKKTEHYFSVPHLHQNGLGELLPVDDLDGHLLARDTVDAQLDQP